MAARRTAPAAAPRPAAAAAAAASNSRGGRAEPPRYAAPTAVLRNVQSVSFVRGVVAATGAMAGVTGARGFLAYALLHVVASVALLGWMRGTPDAFLPQSSPLSFLTSGLGDNLIMYIFVWTLAYALVHIY